MFYCTLCLQMGAYFNDTFFFSIEHRETQAFSVRDTAFGGRFDLIKPDRKFGYMHLVQ